MRELSHDHVRRWLRERPFKGVQNTPSIYPNLPSDLKQDLVFIVILYFIVHLTLKIESLIIKWALEVEIMRPKREPEVASAVILDLESVNYMQMPVSDSKLGRPESIRLILPGG